MALGSPSKYEDYRDTAGRFSAQFTYGMLIALRRAGEWSWALQTAFGSGHVLGI